MIFKPTTAVGVVLVEWVGSSHSQLMLRLSLAVKEFKKYHTVFNLKTVSVLSLYWQIMVI
jgi:hypothetical protein